MRSLKKEDNDPEHDLQKTKRNKTKNKEIEQRKRKSQRLADKSNKKVKKEEISDDSKIMYKVPIQILWENQQSKVMTENDQKNPIMQAIYKRNPVLSNEDGTRFACKLCNKTFVHKRLLNTHLKGHYQAWKYNCSFYGCNFVNKNEFQCHKE